MNSLSFRSRVTAIGAATIALVLGLGSWVTIEALEAGARSDITAQNTDVLDAVSEEILTGTAPEFVQLPVAQDGTEFVVFNSDDQPVNFSVAFVGDAVVLSEQEMEELLNGGNGLDSLQVPDGVLPPIGVEDFALPVSMQSPENFLRTSQEVTAPSGSVFTVTAATPLETVTRGISRLVIGLVIVVPLLVVLGGLALWFALGAALKPVQRISEEASRIAPSNSGRRLPVPNSGDEIATMTETLNDMLDRLDSGLIRQQQFVSDASHELRSPLTTVRASTELAALDEGLDEQTVESLARVRRAAAQLEIVLDDLTELAIGSEAQLVTTDIDVLLLDEVEALPADHGVRVSTENVRPVSAAVHSVRLSRAIRNVLDNAVRHATTCVDVALRSEDDMAVITIDDDGPGVALADRERIFERFVRLDEGRNRVDGGSGLGLALVAAITAEHGGVVQCGEVPGGSGTRVTLTIPV